MSDGSTKLIRVIGVHRGAASTARGRKTVMEDFAKRLEESCNELIAEGRQIRITFCEEGAVLTGEFDMKVMMLSGPPKSVPEPAVEIQETTRAMVQQFLIAAMGMPPMPSDLRDKHLAAIFDDIVKDVPANTLKVAADDIDRILKAQPTEAGASDQAMVVKMRDMLAARAHANLQ